ncbi:MAG: zf-TFIIB domain-containing protein [Actinomycetota bacterium]|nr:zf-TFIIB domain-containing protein [Actinomycetota bacterium]
MADLTCPKCESQMRSYERSGITVDQCTGCRGVFLDRGELERLVDAEGQYYEGRGGGGEREHRRDYDDDDDDRRGGFGGLGGFGGGERHGKRRKREGFLSELFD